MFPGLNPKNMEKVMKQLGMKSESLDAKKVIIETKNKKMVFFNPQVTKIKMGGQEIFQLQGTYSEESDSGEEDERFMEDIKLIAEKAQVSYEEAKKALKETKDITEAIIKLKEK